MSLENFSMIPFTPLMNDGYGAPSRVNPILLDLFPMKEESQSTPCLSPLSDIPHFEPKLLNLFPVNKESDITLNQYPLSDQSKNELNLFPFNDLSHNTLNLFPGTNRSPNTLNLFPGGSQSPDTRSLFPPSDQLSQNTLNQLANQSHNAFNIFPRVEEIQTELSLFLHSDQTQYLPNLSPVTTDPQTGLCLFPGSGDVYLEAATSSDPVASPMETPVLLVPEEHLGIAYQPALAGSSSASLDVPLRREAHSQYAAPDYFTNFGGPAVQMDVGIMPGLANPMDVAIMPGLANLMDVAIMPGLANPMDVAIMPGLVNPAQNPAPGNKSSIFTGVTYYKRTGRWEAHIWSKEAVKQIYLGASYTEIQAARGPEAAGLNFDIADYADELQQLKEISSKDLVAALRKQSHGPGKPRPEYPPPIPQN